MAEPTAASTSPVRFFIRSILPFVLVGLAAAIIVVAWALPKENIDKLHRVLTTGFTIVITLLVLLLWMVLLSGWRWWARLGTLVAAVAVPMTLVHHVSYSGDMVPTFYFRWEKDAAAVLEEHREHARGGIFPGPDVVAAPGDYTEYRGVKRDGVVAGPVLAREWKTQPPKERWRQPIGGGYAGFVVQGPMAVTIEQRRDREAIVCYDTASGREFWAFDYSGNFQEAMGGPGPRATPTIAGGDVFSLGALGDLLCLDLKTGEKKWSVNILADNDNIMWAMSGSPLVYENMVIVNPGANRISARGTALRAYERTTGKLLWASGDTKAGYSSPMLATLGGKLQVLLLDAEVLAGYDIKDGARLWTYAWPVYNGINVAQPLVLDDDRVFISSSYDVAAGAMLKIAVADGKWHAEELWKNNKLRCKMTSPVLRNGYIYGLDEGILTCIDAKTGQSKWRDGRYGHGQILLSGDLIVVLAENGKLALVQATPDAFHELGSIKALAGSKTWNHLALAHGVAYVRNHEEMACYELPLAEKK